MIEESLWREVESPRFRNRVPREVDVIVVGGGITGLTAALLLKQSGKRVAVFERDRIGGGESGSTSAHLTSMVDIRPTALVERFGDGAARLVWRGGQTAIDLIESNSAQGMMCGFQRVPGFLCAPFLDDADLGRERDTLSADADRLQRGGLAAQFREAGPITGRPALSIADQAVFHPRDYVVGLATHVDGDGSVVIDECEVGAAIDDPLAVIVNGENVATTDLVIATHVPIVGIRGLIGATLFQTKLYPHSTYVLGARLRDEKIAPGLYWDTSDPYYYLRVHARADGLYAIFGGADHKTGKESDTESCYASVTATFERLVPNATIERRWSGQVIETDDGLPFIGRVAEHQYVATGFAGNGLTFGTLAGVMVRDAILGAGNPWQSLFDPKRKPASLEPLRTLVAENIDYPMHFIADRLPDSDKSGVENVPRGGGKVIQLDGRRVAVHRSDSGEVTKVSAVCTHLGCIVRWNNAERTWDCPCHGSRFAPDGKVVGGPAEAPLEAID